MSLRNGVPGTLDRTCMLEGCPPWGCGEQGGSDHYTKQSCLPEPGVHVVCKSGNFTAPDALGPFSFPRPALGQTVDEKSQHDALRKQPRPKLSQERGHDCTNLSQWVIGHSFNAGLVLSDRIWNCCDVEDVCKIWIYQYDFE